MYLLLLADCLPGTNDCKMSKHFLNGDCSKNLYFQQNTCFSNDIIAATLIVPLNKSSRDNSTLIKIFL